MKLKEWGVGHLAVLYADNIYGSSFAQGILRAAKEFHPDLNITSVPYQDRGDDDDVTRSVDQLVKTECTYLFGVILPTDLEQLMIECYKRGIAGTGKHVWLFSDSISPSFITSKTFELGSPLGKVYQGTGVLKAGGGLHLLPGKLTQALFSSQERSCSHPVLPNPKRS